MAKKDDFKSKQFKEDEPASNKGKGSKGNQRRNKGFKGNKEPKKGNVNDASYYYTDPNVLASVTNFSFTEFLGVDVEIGSTLVNPTDTGDATLTEQVANVTAIRMNPSVQPTAAEGSTGYEAINVVAMRNYTGLTAGNGKTAQYGIADPMMAVLGIGSAVSMYSHLRRAFNSYMLVNQRNRDYPKLLFKAMGIDWDDFKANIANYRDRFNLTVCQFDKIPMFDSITYLQKSYNMYSNLYVDEDSPLAQTYLFVPNSVWVLNEAYDPAGSGLETTPIPDIATMAELLDIFELQIQRLTTSSTLNYVYSDILRLMSNGKGKAFILPTIGMYPEEGFRPIINEEIRHWINNMVIVNAPVDKDAVPAAISRGCTNSNDVCCDGNTGCILYAPTFLWLKEYNQGSPGIVKTRSKLISMYYNNGLVNFDSMSPSIEDKVAATRLAVRANSLQYIDSTDNYSYTYSHDVDLGDYYCVNMKIYVKSDEDPIGIAGGTQRWLISSVPSISWMKDFVRVWDALGKLKYAPRVSALDGLTSGSEGQNNLLGISGDLSYYTLLGHDVTKRMKDAEMFGLFDFRMSF